MYDVDGNGTIDRQEMKAWDLDIHEACHVLMMIMIVMKLMAVHTNNQLYVDAKDEC